MVDLDFWPRRKIDASDGRRGEDLCDSAGVVPYGELGWCMSRRRELDATDSGPVLLFVRRPWIIERVCDSRGRFREESVLAEIDDVDGGIGEGWAWSVV